MCCFSGTVRSVSGTQIFARDLEGDRQALVYSMTFDAPDALAMVLPIPTPAGAPDDAVRFVDLSDYPDFFGDLHRGFPVPAAPRAQGVPIEPELEVHRVGAFEASFVPHARDFARLDPRFRLAEKVLQALPGSADGWGYAVFKLRGGDHVRDAHPMAFSFPRRDRARLFFPTVHVHDGTVPAEASFDHALYAQFPTDTPNGWWQTGIPAARHVHVERARGLVDGARMMSMVALAGRRPNLDQWA